MSAETRIGAHGRWKAARAPLGWTVGKLARLYDYSMFVLLVGAVVALTILLETDDKIVALKIFAVAYFSLLPAILYLQFASRKTPTVWREYVLTLFRLHADDYSNLPAPPETSRFYGRWVEARRQVGDDVESPEHESYEEGNVYRRRFEELYGPLPADELDGVAQHPGDQTIRGLAPKAMRLGRAHKLQVLLATLLITLGWVFVVQPETVFGRSFTPGDFELRGLPAIPVESFAFAFLGAYFFVLQMLVRRFFQNDLKPTAYVNATMRIIIVILLVWVLDPVLPESLGQAERSAIAFAIGVFPSIGWQALQSIVAVLLKRFVRSLEANNPLSELDGMNVWYEARLVEEGVEDVQNLATTDLGNALLRTRIPPERLIDWVDQALLRLHTNRPPARERKLLGGSEQAPMPSELDDLRRFGIRTATDLLDVFAYQGTTADGKPLAAAVERLLNTEEDERLGRPSVTRCIALGLSGERNLQHILAWRDFRPEPDLNEQDLLRRALEAPPRNGAGAKLAQPARR